MTGEQDKSLPSSRRLEAVGIPGTFPRREGRFRPVGSARRSRRDDHLMADGGWQVSSLSRHDRFAVRPWQRSSDGVSWGRAPGAGHRSWAKAPRGSGSSSAMACGSTRARRSQAWSAMDGALASARAIVASRPVTTTASRNSRPAPPADSEPVPAVGNAGHSYGASRSPCGLATRRPGHPRHLRANSCRAAGTDPSPSPSSPRTGPHLCGR